MKNAPREPAPSSEHCPACGISLDGGRIADTAGFDEEMAIKYYVGADARWSRQIGIEDARVYDGISRWRCSDCKHEWNRFPDSWYKEKSE